MVGGFRFPGLREAKDPSLNPGHTAPEAAVDPQSPALYGFASDVGRTVSPFTEMRFMPPTPPAVDLGTSKAQVVPLTSRRCLG